MDLPVAKPAGGLIPQGAGRETAKLPAGEMTVFTYRPNLHATTGILFVFDGLNRNAAGMRDRAISLAERTGLTIVSPLMDRQRFPKWRYDTAGVVRQGAEQPRERWTGPLLQSLFDWARGVLDLPQAQLYLLGHSAGGQMLSRICAYSPLSSTGRIVITNPSAYVAPTLDEVAPYGFKGIFTPAEALVRLQVYLALPISIYLGQVDTSDRQLAKAEPAMRQGSSRLARGRFVYNAGLEVTRHHAWAFNWKLVEAPGIGHSSRAMLDTPQCAEALGLIPDTAPGRARSQTYASQG